MPAEISPGTGSCQNGYSVTRRVLRQRPTRGFDAGAGGSALAQPTRGERRHENEAHQGGGDEPAEDHHRHRTFDFMSGLM